MDGYNLYTVSNGNYYTFVFVIAKDEENALQLATEAYKKEDQPYVDLRIDLEIENIQGPIASKVVEA